MVTTTVDTLIRNPKGAEFYSFAEMAEFNQKANLPYQSKMSLQPLRERLEQHHTEQSRLLIRLIDQVEEEGWTEVDSPDCFNEKQATALRPLFQTLFPTLLDRKIMGFMARPFAFGFLYTTPYLAEKLMDDEMQIRKSHEDWDKVKRAKIINAGSMILNQFYNQEIDLNFQDILVVRNSKTLLEDYFKLQVKLEFVTVKAVKPLKKLSKATIQNLLNHVGDIDLWLEHLPPENFVFEGIAHGEMTEVTQQEIISRIKDSLVDSDRMPDTEDMIEMMTRNIRSFLRMPEISVGAVPASTREWMNLPVDVSILSHKVKSGKEICGRGSLYDKVCKIRKPILIQQLSKEEGLASPGKILTKSGFESVLLMPLTNPAQEVIGIFELASPRVNRFNAFHIVRLEELRSLLSISMDRRVRELDEKTNLIIQKQFTSMHPSVQWRFKQAAMEILNRRESDAALTPIVFKDLYPLYGQSDIVGSSDIRTKAIQSDLQKNLKAIAKVLQSCDGLLSAPLLDAYALKTNRYLDKVSNNFTSTDESLIIEFITSELNPFLEQLAENHPDNIGPFIEDYFALLDPELRIVYKDRKNYEDSVASLTSSIANFLVTENEKLQEVFPHYFEHYKTDGVEYNMYLGDAISPQKRYSELQLQNFRLWQLVNMTEMARLAAKLEKQLPVPLTTAQLVFVYNSPLSIQFRMDEKQFDVDGAYNVRYEILKKRIDKATVKGGEERLTQPNTISIVYLHDRERQEYQDYLEYLIERKYIASEVEDLELADIQGVRGLRALRVTILPARRNQ